MVCRRLKRHVTWPGDKKDRRQTGTPMKTNHIIYRMSRWKLGSMVRINGLFHLLINEVYWGILGV